ncbi:hypothetical protein RHSIM_Rhsim01G0231400 [Rhododendron simsii]|uniref:Uncharacterized protein n=1 Tax=Rhododendron simsii TaxID=118357 RepID=A0A834HG24_RHOSS|nr:hypothetical protein RHSIM_Rhsim01G0231400 [Rhododendron simsii]
MESTIVIKIDSCLEGCLVLARMKEYRSMFSVPWKDQSGVLAPSIRIIILSRISNSRIDIQDTIVMANFII